MLWPIKKYLLLVMIAAGIALLDLSTKAYARKRKMKIVLNKGAFIGLLKNRKKLLSVLQILSLFFILFLIICYDDYLMKLSLSVIAGGSIGNIVEHISKGVVTDFIRLRNLYVNVADLFIVGGLFFFALTLVFL